MSLYTDSDKKRIVEDDNLGNSYRPPFWKDYASLIHSAAFRRLQGKTQLYPSHENDFFRTRLTHSVEVAQIAKSIALKINSENSLDIDTDLVQFAALAHDIGHPPFGHQGEEALDECMRNDGGFEGNAQTLRIVTRLEKKDKPKNIFDGTTEQDIRFGLNLTSRSIASILKYDTTIPEQETDRQEYANAYTDGKILPVKGYNNSEIDIVDFVKKNVLNGYVLKEKIDIDTGQPEMEKFKTIECQIMDISDDIAYSTYDLEDTLKANFCHPFDIMFADTEIVKIISAKTSKIFKREIGIKDIQDILFKIFNEFIYYNTEDTEKINVSNLKDYTRTAIDISYRAIKNLINDGYIRKEFTSALINRFVSGVTFIPHNEFLPLSTVKIEDSIRLEVEVLKIFNYEVNILSSRLKIPAHRGQQIVKKIFEILSNDKLSGYLLMPADFKTVYLLCNIKKNKLRVVCDFIAGMTDKYCIEFYARLTSENPETIFKPI